MARQGLLRPHDSTITLIQRLCDDGRIDGAQPLDGWIVGVHALAYWLYPAAPWLTDQTIATCVAVIAFYVAGEVAGLYQPWRGVPIGRQVVRVWAAWLPVVMILLVAAFALKATDHFSRVASGSWVVAAPIALT